MKKALGQMQTLRACRSNAEPKIPPPAPSQTPFPGTQDRQNLINWRLSLDAPILQTQFGEDRCTQFRVIVVTVTARPPAANTQTHRQDRLQYTAPLASAQCNHEFI